MVAPAVPRTAEELNQREALKQYALGLICERDNRFLEAVRCFEEAIRLDPEAAPVLMVDEPAQLDLIEGCVGGGPTPAPIPVASWAGA